MTKSKSKAARNAEKRILAKALQSSSSPAAAGGGAMKSKKKKKKSSSFGSLLSGAAKVALEMAPVLLPALLGAHGPTRAALGANPSTSSMVGLAEPASIQPMTGLTDVQPILQDGKVVGLTLTGIDYLAAVTATSASPGDVLNTIDLSIRSSDWAGTRLQRESTLYERFKFKHLCVIYEPAASATETGQLVGYIDTDAAESFEESGRSAVQVATAHAGAEINQVWQMGIANYVPDNNTQDFYADAEGSDVRLTSPGKYRLIAVTSIVADPPNIGALYACYVVELKIPQLEESSGAGAYASWSGNADVSTSAAAPFGNSAASLTEGINTLKSAYWFTVGAELGYTGFPAGRYLIVFGVDAGTSATTASITVVGSAMTLTELWQSDGTTPTEVVYAGFLVVPDSAVAETDYLTFSFATLVGTPNVYPRVDVVAVPVGASLTRRLTLQDYERTTLDVAERLSSLERLVAGMGSSAPPAIQSAALKTIKPRVR